MSGDLFVYLGLFGAAFAAATLVPAQSEALLLLLVVAGEHPVLLLVVVASLGNVLGSLVNWLLGRGIERFSGRRWFPVSPQRLEGARRWYARYGKWSLLLSWLPVIGDPITLLAGVLRVRLAVFLPLVVVAKAGRYAALAWAAGAWS